MDYEIPKIKLKNFIKRKFGVDLTDKIEMITSVYDIPKEFGSVRKQIQIFMNNYGPAYYFITPNNTYIAIPHTYQGRDLIQDGNMLSWDVNKITKDFGIQDLGLTLQDLIDIYVEEQ